MGLFRGVAREVIAALRPIWAQVLVLTALSAVFIERACFVLGGETYFVLFDDGMISMRYARNLIEGHGLVWNVGQPPIEGFTNLLWTLWMALVQLLPLPDSKVSIAVAVSGWVALVALLVCVRLLALELSPDRPALASAATWAVAGFYPLYYWTLRGMEVGLEALLITSAALVALRVERDATRGRLIGLGALVAAGYWTRDDAIVPLFLAVAYACAFASAPRRRATIAYAGGATFGALAAKALFRLAYFHDLLPNTYYLKMGGVPLGVRLERGFVAFTHLLQTGLWLPLFAAIVAATASESRRRRLFLLATALSACAYSIYVGGDAWEELDYANRFISPIIPVLLLLAVFAWPLLVEAAGGPRARLIVALAVCVALGVFVSKDWPWFPAQAAQLNGTEPRWLAWREYLAFAVAALLVASALWSQVGRRGALVWTAALVLVCSGEAWRIWLDKNAAHLGPDRNRTRHGLALREATAPDAVIGVTPAGIIPFFSRRTTIDFLGKSEAHIAHEPPRVLFHPGHSKWDYEYAVGELKPDVCDELYGIQRDGLMKMVYAWGYQPLSLTLFVRRGDPKVDVAKIAELARGDRNPP